MKSYILDQLHSKSRSRGFATQSPKTARLRCAWLHCVAHGNGVAKTLGNCEENVSSGVTAKMREFWPLALPLCTSHYSYEGCAAGRECQNRRCILALTPLTPILANPSARVLAPRTIAWQSCSRTKRATPKSSRNCTSPPWRASPGRLRSNEPRSTSQPGKIVPGLWKTSCGPC
jgi:hypothetical protein